MVTLTIPQLLAFCLAGAAGLGSFFCSIIGDAEARSDEFRGQHEIYMGYVFAYVLLSAAGVFLLFGFRVL